MIKRICTFLLAFLLLPAVCLHTSARDKIDLSAICSATFTMEYAGNPLDGGRLTVCRVGDIVWQGEGYGFKLIPALEDSGVPLDKPNDLNVAKKLAELAAERGLPHISADIKAGQAVFNGLSTGLYVVVQPESDATPQFTPISPFLISLPQWKGDDYYYNTIAAPKVSITPVATPTPPPAPTPTPPPELPDTGQLNWPVPVLAGCGTAMVALGIFLCCGKGKSYEE